MGATLLTNSVPLPVAGRLQLLLTAFVFLQVRRVPAAPQFPPLRACSLGMKLAGTGSRVLHCSAAGPESCWPELAGGSPPCSCAGHSYPSPSPCPAAEPRDDCRAGEQQEPRTVGGCSGRALLRCGGFLRDRAPKLVKI